MRNIVIYGCGGFGREVLQVIHAINAEGPTWNVLGFAVDPGIVHPETVHGLPVTSDLSTFGDDPLPDVVIAIGAPAARKRIALRLGELGYIFPTLVHPGASLGRKVVLGKGAVIMAGASLTTDIEVADHVQINPCVTVGHDTSVGSFTTISPGANLSGNVTLAEEVEIGTGASIIQRISVGRASVIGAGAAVVRAIPENSVAVGVPAKVIRTKSDPA
ncbi:acetyltransferase [Thioclava sp. DLFJ5-1]|uniref:acetyltransferase n=1 Tax=Thioclava sp. DLFJ5-1 TaxID=1915314 RepID=UPI0009978573|nr:acetyltransferase [Thioclava sp. DLFJ5-1]OOY19521.1 acetyltransferase [Thioclava sp. DLFJ5-1]